jgi:hypothetical protein
MKQGGRMSVENRKLSEASIQEIQLELVRRWGFNEFDGKEVYADLMSNSHLWQGVVMDSSFPLVKLRDMVDDGLWNVDLLYIWAKDEQCAQQLLEFGEKWRAASAEICSTEEMNELMGTLGRKERRLVVMWWD